MALDEATLFGHPRISLRFYRWDTPQITFGYFGNHAEIAARFPAWKLTRRWTGGGIVEHGNDLTFSLTIPHALPEFQFSGSQLYAAIHSAIVDLLAASTPSGAWLAAKGTSDGMSPCFASPVKSDVVGPNGKIAGGAIRKTRAGILYQGSIRHEDPEILNTIRRQMPCALCPQNSPRDIPPELLARTSELVATKYGTREWLHRR